MKKDLHDTNLATSSWHSRKKAKTRAVIQREALRLFKEQGYNETTIEQIAEAAEISRMTFFRYFATKADVVLCDVDFVDRKIIEITLSEPSEIGVIQALRNAFSKLYLESSSKELAVLKERYLLLRTVPELCTAIMNYNIKKIHLIGEMVAKRNGRNADDFEVWNYAGVIGGIWIAAWVSTEKDTEEGFINRFYQVLDAGLKHLEEGLPL